MQTILEDFWSIFDDYWRCWVTFGGVYPSAPSQLASGPRPAGWTFGLSDFGHFWRVGALKSMQKIARNLKIHTKIPPQILENPPKKKYDFGKVKWTDSGPQGSDLDDNYRFRRRKMWGIWKSTPKPPPDLKKTENSENTPPVFYNILWGLILVVCCAQKK